MKMSGSNPPDFQRCRLCALPISSNSLISFVNTIYEPMIVKLKSFGLRIKKDDGLPECICHGCTGILTTFIETMELFLEADKKLKKILETSKLPINENHIFGTKTSIESKDNQQTKRSKRKSGEDIKYFESKKTKKRDHLNLLRKVQTPMVNNSKNMGGKETEDKSEQVVNLKNDLTHDNEPKENKSNSELEIIQKQEKKQNMETNKCVNNVSDFEFVNVIGKHDHDYSMDLNSTYKTDAKEDSYNKAEIDISQENDSETQIKKNSPKHIKVLTLDKVRLKKGKKVHPSTTTSSLPPVYTKPSDDKEIDVFTCLECNQLFWNREKTLEHIYKEHARGALTYKARYMVKRIKNSKAYNSRKQIVCMLCYFLVPDSDPNAYLEHLTGHYMRLYKCFHCEQNFSSREAFEKHKNAYKNHIMMCKICDQTMPLEVFAAHQRSHSWFARTQAVNEKKLLKGKERSKSCSQISDDKSGKGVKHIDRQNTIQSEKSVETDLEEIICEGAVNINERRSEDNETFSKSGEQPLEAADEDKTDDEVEEMPEEKLKFNIQKKELCFYKCANCLRIFKDRGAILKHIQRVHPQTWGNKKSLLAAKKLQSAKEEADANEIYMCRICPIDFDSESKFFQHLEVNHHCKFCAKTFFYKEEMKIHLRAHEKPYRCTICDASFYVEKNYLDHKLTHTYNCELCNASYRSIESLTNHKKVSHTKISCPICSLSLDSPELLSKHEGTHRKKNSPCLCELCGKSYTNASRFNYHMQTHGADTEFNCKFCPMSFKNAAKLKRHQRFSHLHAYTESLRESLESELT
ncbi:zinc finger protein 84-like isoform X2 [Belonocnema kinseyi]|nr:zinc finger protein 84-like isoform X2 [Belonocnema kinseyi]